MSTGVESNTDVIPVFSVPASLEIAEYIPDIEGSGATATQVKFQDYTSNPAGSALPGLSLLG